MDSENDLKNNENQMQQTDTSSKLIEVSETAMLEYLEIIKSEYENERNKKQSFENRAGLIMALLGAICIFLFEKVQLKDVFALMTIPVTFIDLLEIFSGFAVYVGFIFTMTTIIETIVVKQHNNFEVKNITESLLIEQRIGALCRLIFTYRDIILQHRALNEKRAVAFKKSIIGISVTLVSVIIYITIK